MSEGELGDHRPSAPAGTPAPPSREDRCWRSDTAGARNLFSCPKGVILVHVAHAARVRGTDAGIAGAPSPGTQTSRCAFQTLWPTVQGHIVP